MPWIFNKGGFKKFPSVNTNATISIFSSIQENKKEDFTRAKLDFEECSQLGILIDKEQRKASNA